MRSRGTQDIFRSTSLLLSALFARHDATRSTIPETGSRYLPRNTSSIIWIPWVVRRTLALSAFIGLCNSVIVKLLCEDLARILSLG
jgi:hypothetical protein